MVSNKQTNADVTLHAFPLYPRHNPCHHKIPFLFPWQRCTPQFTPRPITNIWTLRVVTRVPSVTGKSVLYIISWRIKRYAHTVFTVLEETPDPMVLWQGFDVPCRPRTSDNPSTYCCNGESEAQYGYSPVTWDDPPVHRFVPQACRFGFGFSDVQTSTGSNFISQ